MFSIDLPAPFLPASISSITASRIDTVLIAVRTSMSSVSESAVLVAILQKRNAQTNSIKAKMPAPEKLRGRHNS
jgi:hypothetical protein